MAPRPVSYGLVAPIEFEVHLKSKPRLGPQGLKRAPVAGVIRLQPATPIAADPFQAAANFCFQAAGAVGDLLPMVLLRKRAARCAGTARTIIEPFPPSSGPPRSWSVLPQMCIPGKGSPISVGTMSDEKIDVDASRPATLNNGGTLDDCPTLQEAVMAWHRLPPEQRENARPSGSWAGRSTQLPKLSGPIPGLSLARDAAPPFPAALVRRGAPGVLHL